MAVLILNMDMPDNCHVCVAGYGGLCFVAPPESDALCPDSGRATWCPLVEVPIPKQNHDMDKLMEESGWE